VGPSYDRESQDMELGIYTFGDLKAHPLTGKPESAHARLTRLIELAKSADRAGLDIIALGEHHRKDYVISAPEVVLGAMAAVTSRIRLSTAVTVLSTQDPVRVFQQFATIDQISGGRAEIMAGRGAFVESFPLFGYNLDDYEELFDEKIRLLLELRDNEVVTWRGRLRPSLEAALISPRPFQGQLPVWIGVGGTPQSAVRAGVLGTPMFMSFFQGPDSGRRLVDLYHRAAASAGHDPGSMKLASGGHIYISPKSQTARDEYHPYYSDYFTQLPQFARGMPREVFDQWVRSGLIVGSPQEVIDKILHHREVLGVDRYVGQIEVGSIPGEMVDASLELFANEVAPVIRRETAVTASPT
jgi:alkanesulfonate monooxygenase SsuD/methylene tetrahydromethanopterin reductase-like flavin-dependent oxidoreductase (luciferase family)